MRIQKQLRQSAPGVLILILALLLFHFIPAPAKDVPRAPAEPWEVLLVLVLAVFFCLAIYVGTMYFLDMLDQWIRRKTRDQSWLWTEDGEKWLNSPEGRQWQESRNRENNPISPS